MTPRRTLLLLILVLAVLAGGLRFFRLGAWPFHGDELAMQAEVAIFGRGPDPASTLQADRLPRLIPLSYGAQFVSYSLFGSNEFGSRVLPALLGTLYIVMVFVLLDRTMGRATALATSLLLAFWPEHVYRSQENRFYMIAAVPAALCMLAGARAVQKRSGWWAALACGAALTAVFAHTLQGMLLGGLFLGIGVAAWRANDGRLVRLLGIVAAGGVIAAGVFVIYLLPIVRGWNGGGSWGYPVSHSVMASASQLGWPILLLALLGFLLLCRNGDALDCYWASWAAVWAGASVLLPLVVAYHPAYVFPLSLGVLVLAGRAVAQVYEGLRTQSAMAGYAWVALACLFSLPSLVSHYSDGSRLDYRTPAEHVGARWQPGDRVAAVSPGLLQHYTRSGVEPIGINADNPVPALRRLAQGEGRLWIVVPSFRGGKPEPLRKWLGTHCSQELRTCGKRFDYYENATEVYLYVPITSGPAWAHDGDVTRTARVD
ncbi:MAG: glycosyltransferase family 39 protein [Gemmataceae bacterium]|nr:glycosyltransferase family 39 protein [Gemmataceae bacterium]